jgi:hypothetical protein
MAAMARLGFITPAGKQREAESDGGLSVMQIAPAQDLTRFGSASP